MPTTAEFEPKLKPGAQKFNLKLWMSESQIWVPLSQVLVEAKLEAEPGI